MFSFHDCPILEMATIGKNVKLGKDNYRIEIHGPASKDRSNPHIHIYLSSDSYPWNKFNFEISLTDIICNDEINLIRMKDVSKRKDITNRTKCSWEGYSKMLYDFEDWLYSDKVSIKGDYIDNLDALIWWYNQESNSENEFLDYLIKHGLKVHPNYYKYFNKQEQEKFKQAFN